MTPSPSPSSGFSRPGLVPGIASLAAVCALACCPSLSAQLLTKLAELEPGQRASSPRDFLEIDERTVFLTEGDQLGTRMWRTNGTTAGTVEIANLGLGRSGRMHLVGDRLLVLVTSFNAPTELWASDGTSTGTRLVGPLGSGMGRFGDTATAGGRLFYVIDRDLQPDVLAVTDGTLAGSGVLAQFLVIRELHAFDDEIVFLGVTAQDGPELWRSDGTVSGTRLLADLTPGPDGSLSSSPIAFRGGIYFVRTTGSVPQGLWVSDGTAAGTREVSRFTTAPADAGLLGAAGDHIYFWLDQGRGNYQFYAIHRTTDAVSALGPQTFLRDGVEFLGQLYARDGNFDGNGIYRLDAPTNTIQRAEVTQPHRSSDTWLVTGSRRAYVTIDGVSYLFGSGVPLTVLNRNVFLVSAMAVAGHNFYCSGRLANELWEPYVGPVGAYAMPFGHGVGSGLRIPELRGEDPLPGTTSQISLRDAPLDTPVGLVIGLHGPLPVSLDRDAVIYVDPARSVALSARSDLSGSWSSNLQVPQDTALIGQRLTLQALAVNPQSSRGFELSNGLVLRIGR